MSRSDGAAAKRPNAPRWRPGLLVLVMALMLALAGCSEEAAPENPYAEPTVNQSPKPKVKHRKIRVSKPIPFATEVIKTSSLPEGEEQVQVAGRAGVRIRVIRLSTKLGKIIERDIVNRFVSREPVNKVLLVGTMVEPEPEPSEGGDCDPNYAGGCVPIASDVDCAGGEGDGPEYVDGPVTVVGDDIYDLNRDEDVIACDS